MSDKEAMTEVATFKLVPANLLQVLTGVLSQPGRSPGELSESVSGLVAVVQELVALSGELYARPDFRA